MAARRTDYEGAWHHVMNRGARRQTVFHLAVDAQRFLELVGQWSDATDTEVHAYCLLDNHYHLLVRSTSGQLSRFMQRVGAGYTGHLNRRLGRDGAVFRGRFRSQHVASDQYLSVLSRYIHRNPTAKLPDLALDQYRWSSYGAYVGTLPAPPWLRTAVLLARHGDDRSAFRAHVERPSRVDDPEHLADLVSAVLDEHSGQLRGQAGRLERVMTVALLDHLAADVRNAVVRQLGFGGDAAHAELRRATQRARRRVADDPVLQAVLARTLSALGHADLTTPRF